MNVLIVNDSKLRLSSVSTQKAVDFIVQRLLRNKTLKNKLRLKRQELTIAFVSRGKMKTLNQDYRKKDKVTDILSFAPSDFSSLGDLALCPTVLKKQALENGHSLNHEILYILVHGILHLLGYDHEDSKSSEKKMFLLQDRLFTQLTDSKINLNITYVYRRRS